MTTEVYSINVNSPNIVKFQDNDWDNIHGITTYNNIVYAITDSQLYTHTGNNDYGSDIDAYFTTGYINFNTNSLKRFPAGSIYISYDSDNEGILTLYNSTDGVDDTDYYDVPIDSTYPEYFRPTTWDGMKARYWKFKLQNTNGSDFSLEDWYVNFYPTGRAIK